MKNSRPDFIVNYKDILREPFCYPNSDEPMAQSAPVGRKTGLKKIGVHLTIIKPGQRTSWPHAEENEEEFVYIISGHPDVWINGVLHRLGPGDAVGFPSGTGIMHTFINNTQTDVTCIVVGETEVPGSRIIYAPHLHQKRNEDIRAQGAFWEDAPKQEMGDHNGLPDALV